MKEGLAKESVIEIATTINKYIKENDELRKDNDELRKRIAKQDSRIRYEVNLYEKAFQLTSGHHGQNCKCSKG